MVTTKALTSAANPLLKDIRRAIARGSLTEDGCCVAEGFHLLDEALRSGREVPWVLVSESARAQAQSLAKEQIAVLPDALFGTIAATETTQGVIGLVRPPEWTVPALFLGQSLVVVLDGIQDPGNAGAIVRSAEAFGATGVMFLKGTTSPFNSKTIRASAGSLFRIPFVAGLDGVTALRENQVQVYAAVPFSRSVRIASETDLTRPCAIVIGSEARGVGSELYAHAESIAIPTIEVESLNAAVAASILLYEARRQRAVRS